MATARQLLSRVRGGEHADELLPEAFAAVDIAIRRCLGFQPFDVQLAAGIILAIVLHVLLSRTTFGFAVRVAGGNARAALAQGLPVGRLIVICCMIAGACAGLAGFYEVAAIQGRANASLAAGYGYTGILVAFLARHNPLAIVPVAILFGGIVASGGLIERRMGLPDATVLVLQGLTFVVLLMSETLYGRFKIFQDHGTADRT